MSGYRQSRVHLLLEPSVQSWAEHAAVSLLQKEYIDKSVRILVPRTWCLLIHLFAEVVDAERGAVALPAELLLLVVLADARIGLAGLALRLW